MDNYKKVKPTPRRVRNSFGGIDCSAVAFLLSCPEKPGGFSIPFGI
jgi:hypothetical protein